MDACGNVSIICRCVDNSLHQLHQDFVHCGDIMVIDDITFDLHN